ncbi:hypothetical protein ALT1644_340006 [Alteromonas macleodii]
MGPYSKDRKSPWNELNSYLNAFVITNAICYVMQRRVDFLLDTPLVSDFKRKGQDCHLTLMSNQKTGCTNNRCDRRKR